MTGHDSLFSSRFGRVRRWLLLRLLDQYADALERQGKEFDGVLNVMDSVVGWCHPRYRLDD